MSEVLIVEDEDDIAELLRFSLCEDGHQPSIASTAAEARAHIARVPPDLVLLDLMLPDVSGVEICRRLKAGPDPIPVIVVTARAQEADRLKALELGADDFVTKPFCIRELLLRVRAVLRGRPAGSRAEPRERLIRVSPAAPKRKGSTPLRPS